MCEGSDVSGVEPTERVSVGLIGLRGYGAVHLREIDRLVGRGKVRLVGCADVAEPDHEGAEVISRLGAVRYGDYRRLLEESSMDVVVVASPPHLHAVMATDAMDSGCHVLIEKPPAVTVSAFEALLDVATRLGRHCQVGFQSLGSGALGRMVELRDCSTLGSPQRIGAVGHWRRDRRYWSRSNWAGRRSLAGAEVRDGALSNPFAHAVMNCLVACRANGRSRFRSIEVERYRANAIEVEDSATLRVVLETGTSFVVAVTLCAERESEPELRLIGPKGGASWSYEGDNVRLLAGSESVERYKRESLLEELADVVAGRRKVLSSPLEQTRPFVDIVEAVHAAPVKAISETFVREEGAGLEGTMLVRGVDESVDRAVATGTLFSECGADWVRGAHLPPGP